MTKLIDPAEVLRPFKYEIYCSICGDTVFLTDYRFDNGQPLIAKYLYNPDGTKAKKNQVIKCGCEYQLNPLFGTQQFLIRENKDYGKA